MALFNEIQVGRFNAILHKLFDMKEGAPSPQLASEILPVLTLEGDRPEWAFLAGVRLAAGVGRRSGAVGEVSQVHLNNPSLRNALVVMDQFWVSSATSQEVIWGLGTLPGGATQIEVEHAFRDSRLSSASQTSTGIVYVSGPAAHTVTSQIGAVQLRANPGWNHFPNYPIILGPSDTFTVAAGVTNTALTVGFAWRERALEASETR